MLGRKLKQGQGERHVSGGSDGNDGCVVGSDGHVGGGVTVALEVLLMAVGSGGDNDHGGQGRWQ